MSGLRRVALWINCGDEAAVIELPASRKKGLTEGASVLTAAGASAVRPVEVPAVARDSEVHGDCDRAFAVAPGSDLVAGEAAAIAWLLSGNGGARRCLQKLRGGSIDPPARRMERSDASGVSMSLAGCPNIGKTGVAAVAAALCDRDALRVLGVDGGPLVALRALDLSRCDVGDTGARALAKCCGVSTLELLFLRGNRVTAHGATAFASSLATQLEVSKASDDPAARLHAPGLRTLDLGENPGVGSGAVALAVAADERAIAKEPDPEANVERDASDFAAAMALQPRPLKYIAGRKVGEVRVDGKRTFSAFVNTTLESVDLTGSLDGAPPEADDEDKDLERKAHAALVSRAHVAAGVIANTASRLGRLDGLALGESLRDLGAGGDELLALENATLLPWLQDRSRDEAALAVSRGGAPKPATQLLLTNATKVPFDMTELKELYRHYFCAAVPRDFDEAPDDRAPPPFRGLGDRKGQAEAICLSDKWRRVSAYPKFAQAIEGLLAARAASRDRRERRSVLGKVLGLLRQLRYYAMQERDDWLSRRTLIVDDSQTMRALLRRTFENAGFSVDCASDGREAYEAMKGTRYDMVVMDLDMPVMDGVASTASIRQRQAGANFFEAKPLKMAGLLEKTHEEIHATVSACETARQPADLPPSTAAPSASGDCAEGLSDGLSSGAWSDGELSLGSFGGPRGFALMPTLPRRIARRTP
ncbi:histidine kinase [Aureococcus anophagefferens]|nr:histidine kinase [Aureococcus anophagefferens]